MNLLLAAAFGTACVDNELVPSDDGKLVGDSGGSGCPRPAPRVTRTTGSPSSPAPAPSLPPTGVRPEVVFRVPSAGIGSGVRAEVTTSAAECTDLPDVATLTDLPCK